MTVDQDLGGYNVPDVGSSPYAIVPVVTHQEIMNLSMAPGAILNFDFTVDNNEVFDMMIRTDNPNVTVNTFQRSGPTDTYAPLAGFNGTQSNPSFPTYTNGNVVVSPGVWDVFQMAPTLYWQPPRFQGKQVRIQIANTSVVLANIYSAQIIARSF